MKLSQTALQLFSLREFCKTADDFARTLSRVREIGYPAVQISGVGAIAPAEIARLCAENGLVICATHEDSELLRKQPLRAIERLREMGTNQTAYPWPGGVDFTSASSVDSLIDDLDAAGAVFRENGCTLSYHNHGIEFLKIDGETVFHRIFRRAAPQNLAFELDTYWAQFGGAEPAALCELLAGRLPLLHLKDYMMLPEHKPSFAAIGEGNLDFKKIIAAAETSGCEWFIVEQDSCVGDPFEAVGRSFRYIAENLVVG